MTDNFLNQIMRTSVAALCQSMGWNSAHASTIDILADVWKRHLVQMAKSVQRYAEHDGRVEANLDDVSLVFKDMNVSVTELQEYVQHFEPVRLPYDVPNFPVERESHLNLLRPGSSEVLTRPVHIHEYMPPWETEEKKEKQTGEQNGSAVSETGPPVVVIDDSESDTEALKTEASASPSRSPSPRDMKEVVEGSDGQVVEDMEVDVKEVEIEDSSIKEESPVTPPTSSSLPYSPFSGQPVKSAKREINGENPALKRVRMELEEEGHPLREISSVMMTTSGFLSSNREGRLPDARPPLNRDFFDPEPVVEKKKKIPTMKKIVEGIKKLDKEKENQTQGTSEEMELFGKPDKIKVGEPKSSRESIAQKYKDRSKLSFKLSSSSSKKDFKYGDRDSKAEKLKIFKKTLKGYEKYRKDKKKIKPRVANLEDEDDDGLDEISSEEDFNEAGSSKSKEKEDTSKKERKRIKELFILKSKKDKTKEKISSKILISPVVSSSGESPEKKKRGRPRKVPESIPALFGDPFTPVIKLPKLSKMPKKRHAEDMNRLVPEINLKKSRTLPPPPDLISFMGRLPMQPGLIPASFGPPPPLRLGGGTLPPSISITPATPSASVTSNPMSSKERKNSSLPIPPNVCSSVTITRIDMSGSQKLPSQYDNSSTPGIGNQRPSVQISVTGRKSPSPAVLEIQPDVSSGITITPILMTGDQTGSSSKTGSGLAKLEEDMRTKEQKRKDKEKRKELKKEKKKEKRDKLKDKERVAIFESFDKIEKEKKKDKDRDRERDRDQEKKKKKESPPVVEKVIPKLTLKLHGSSSTAVDSSGHSQRDKSPVPAPRKITIKPVIDESARKRTPSPELARFVPLVTRPSKTTKVPTPKPSPPVPAGDKGSSDGKRGRPPGSRGRGRPPKASSSSQAALVTETVGFYIDEHGEKVWICPTCGRQDDGSPMIGCDTCDDWYHFSCVGIKETPDEHTSWFCQRCRFKKKSKSIDSNSSFDYKKKVPRL